MTENLDNTESKSNDFIADVNGCTSNFLVNAFNSLFVYKTPPKVIDYINKHRYDFLIQNPPYDVCKNTK